MSNFTTNINPDEVIEQLEKESKVKVFTAFNPKNYLNDRLEPNETTKTLTIRLLPPNADGGFPFTKVHMHTIKVNKEIQSSGWKQFVCPIHNKLGDSCPFCEVSEQAWKTRSQVTIESEKKKYQEIANLNRAKESYVVRCIERGHEEDGVKFWLVSGSKDGPYNQIMGIWQTRWKKAQERGKINNIFDLNEGKDLEITITRTVDGKKSIKIVDNDEKTPLTEDFEQGLKWIQDKKQWTDVYKVKPYQYMEIILNGDVPVWNQEKGQYVGKYAAQKEKEEGEKKEQIENYTEQKVDYSKMPTEQQVQKSGIFMNSEVNDDDIPF